MVKINPTTIKKEEMLDLRKENMRNWYWNIKKKTKCSMCPESDPICIDFHHKNPLKKVGTILEMIQFGYSLKACQLELEKMTPLCANCHRKIEYKKRTLNIKKGK